MKTLLATALFAAMTALAASAMTTDSASIVALVRSTPELAIDNSVPPPGDWSIKTHPFVRLTRAPEGTTGGFIDPDFAASGLLAPGTRVIAVPLESGGSGGVFTQVVFAQSDENAKPFYAGYIHSGGHLVVNVGYHGIEAILPKYGPNDPNCCPSHYLIQTYTIENGKLKLVSEKTVVRP
jgi:hypothetical protein